MVETVLDGPAGPLVVHQERAVGAAPAVVLLHSWWGMTDHFRRVSQRLAAVGLTAVAPDLYVGAHTDDPVRARELRTALGDDTALAMGGAAVRYAAQLAGARPVGLLGFSMGGELALRLAVACADRVGAVVSFYGVCVPDGLARLRAPVQLHVATDDEFATPEEIGDLAAALVGLDKSLELHSYPGTRHAFYNTEHPESYQPEAAEAAWRSTHAFLAGNLAAPAATDS